MRMDETHLSVFHSVSNRACGKDCTVCYYRAWLITSTFLDFDVDWPGKYHDFCFSEFKKACKAGKRHMLSTTDKKHTMCLHTFVVCSKTCICCLKGRWHCLTKHNDSKTKTLSLLLLLALCYTTCVSLGSWIAYTTEQPAELELEHANDAVQLSC